MNDHALDPFEQIRGELLTATTRHRRRAERRRHVSVIVAVVLTTLVFLTGIAAAANEHVADALRDASGSIEEIFSGPPAAEQPSPTANQLLDHMEESISNGANAMAPPSKVLLHATVNGYEAEIVANQRPAGSPTHWGPSDGSEICTALVINDQPRQGMCTTTFIPYTPVNYGIGREDTRPILSGLAADTVIGVDVQTDRGLEHAAFGDHAFFWTSDDAEPEVVIVYLEDGSSLHYSAHALPGTATSTQSRSAPRASSPRPPGTRGRVPSP